jgi:hypothetical protein
MDDLEDISNDRRDEQMTIFAQNAGRWPLDALTNRTMQFGHKVFDGMACFPSADTLTFQEFLVHCIDPLLIASAGECDPFYTPVYLAQLETYLPFHYAYLRKLRQKLARQKISMLDIVRLLDH